MDIYIAICCDRHIDEVVKVFTSPELAIEYAKTFATSGGIWNEKTDIEESLTDSMIRSGCLYYATYSPEGDSVRVEKSVLDPLV